MTCDTSSIVPNSPDVRGRDSVRIHSKGWFGEVLVVADIAHMPSGCGTWPAFWTNGYGPWPAGGEFDIIEGTNGGGKNRVTLHTQSNQCAIPKVKVPGMSDYSGQVRRHECTYGAGCSIEDQNAKSWAAPFNANGGGWYVMRRNRGGFAVWFFERNGNVPAAIRDGHGTVEEEALGKKVADFPFWNGVAGENCHFQEQFTDHQLIFNIAMGGHWAEGNFKNFGCEGEIYDLILNHPEKLSEAYWLINSLRIYGPDGDAAVTPDAQAAAAPQQTTAAEQPAPPVVETEPSASTLASETPSAPPSTSPGTPTTTSPTISTATGSAQPSPESEEPAPEQPSTEEPATGGDDNETPAPPAESESAPGDAIKAAAEPAPEGDNDEAPAPPPAEEGESDEPEEEGRRGRGRGRFRGSWRGGWRSSAYRPGSE